MSAVHVCNVELIVSAACFMLVTVQATIIQKPELDTVAVVGERVVLRCSTNLSTVNWTYDQHVTRNETTIFDGRRVAVDRKSHYMVNTSSPGQLDLVIPSVTATDAGSYKCRDADDRVDRVSSLLYVIISLTCTMKSTNSSDGLVVELDNLTVNCFLNYSSYWHWVHPNVTLMWSDIHGVKWVVFKHDDNRYEQNKFLRTEFSTVATIQMSTPAYMHNCSLVFDEMRVSRRNLCNVQNLNVLFPTKAIRVIPLYNGSIYMVGTVLMCQADGNPTVWYEWTDSEGSVLSSTSEMTLSVEGKHDYRCTASNVIRGVTHRQSTNFSVDVIDFRKRESHNMGDNCLNGLEASTQQRCHVSLLLGLGTAVVCLQFVALIFVVIYCRRQNARYREMEVAREGVSDSFNYKPLRLRQLSDENDSMNAVSN